VISGLEAVADAIMSFEGWKIGSRSYENRNPGNLRLQGRTADDTGYTIFPDLPTGYAALLRELQSKFSGANSHGIGPSSTLLSLFNVYAPPSDNNPTNAYAQFVANWCVAALGKPITIESELCNIWQSQPATLNAGDD
jgi:hypothetical protein